MRPESANGPKGGTVNGAMRTFTSYNRESGTLSEFLNLLEPRGQCWCMVDIKSSGGFSIPPNEEVLFYAVLRGQVRIAGVVGGTIVMRPGDVVMILSGEAHALRYKADSPVVYLDFLCEDRQVDIPPTIALGGDGPVAARVLCGRLKVNWPSGLRRTSMPPLIRIAADEFGFTNAGIRVENLQVSARGSGACALLTRTAAIMFTIALRNHPQCPVLFRLSASSDPIAQALHLISADPAADWSVASLARAVNMGRSNFAARFSAEVGRTPMDIVTERRMRHAAKLLREGELRIVEISARVGYRSEAAFSRRFTRFFGLSPSQMRHNAQLSKRAEAKELAWQMLLESGQPTTRLVADS